MKNTWKKVVACMLALALVTGASPVNVDTGGLMPGMGLTAYAATDTYTTLKNNVTVVQFNGYNWYIIEDNSTSATEGTVTLLAADNSFGLSKFSDSESSVYSSSKIKAALDEMTQEGGAFADVADAIVSTDLEDVSVTGAKLYLLSTSEAQNLNSTILNYNFPGSDKANAGGAWWLRSPGSSNSDKYAACVFGSTAYTVGNVHAVGNKATWNYGVRPALKLNLESVIFSSKSNSFSLKPAHTHSFTYTADDDTITATCGAEDCPLEDKTATMTIAPSSVGSYGATLSGDAAEFDVADSDIEYSSDGETWSKTVPTTSGSYQARITVAENYTASVSYGVHTINTDKTYTDNDDHGTISVPTAATVGNTVTIETTPEVGFELDSLTVTKAGGGTVDVAIEGNNGTFTMPAEDVTVSAAFVGKPVTASLSVTGNTGTTCTAALLDSTYKEVSSVTQKAGEKFILLVDREDEYDFKVKYGENSDVSMTEFNEDEYKAYVAYAKDNNITVPSNMVLAWVTMPGVANDSVTLTVDFSKLQTFTVLYQPSDSGTTAVWCKFAKTEGGETVTASSQMKSDATMGDGSQVYSLKVTAAFAPTSVAFAAAKDDVDAVTNDSMTACSTKTGTSDSDWTTITDSGKFCVIGGDAKTVIVAFVSDANNMAVYNSDTVKVDEGTGTDGVTYRVAIVTDGSAGTVTAPENTPTKEGYDFAGWRGFEGTAPNKTEKIYKAGDSISVSENTTLNAVWNLKKSTVTLNLNGGTGNSSIDPVAYGEKLPTLETPTRSGFAFDGWKVSKAVTENGVPFAKGSPFDLDTPITADLELTAQWKHVHSYTCYQISSFPSLANYQKYNDAIHVAVCGCNDIQLMAHEFDENGKCACGYQKPGAPDVTLNISYGQWSNGAYTEKMKGMPETAKQGQEVSICAPDAWGDLQFSKWQYSTDNSTWYDLTANDYVSFLIPATMYVRALYVNPVTVPQVDLSARQYDDHTEVNGKTYTMDNILFQMNYKLPDGCTFVDAGVRMGDNAGISYYELKEITYTANSEAKALVKGFAALGVLVSVDPTNARFAREADSSETKTFYEVHKNSVLDEMSAATLAEYMYESKPINVEKYDPIYWEAKAKTKGMSGSINTLPPLRFAQKDNQNHWIYGIGWLRYKDSSGNIKTIYTEALPATVNKMPNYTVKADTNGKTNTKLN